MTTCNPSPLVPLVLHFHCTSTIAEAILKHWYINPVSPLWNHTTLSCLSCRYLKSRPLCIKRWKCFDINNDLVSDDCNGWLASIATLIIRYQYKELATTQKQFLLVVKVIFVWWWQEAWATLQPGIINLFPSDSGWILDSRITGLRESVILNQTYLTYADLIVDI